MLDRICRNSHIILALALCSVLPCCVAAQKSLRRMSRALQVSLPAGGLILMVEND